MTATRHLALGLGLFRLLLNIFVFWPAMTAATGIFVLLLYGASVNKELGEPLHRFVISASFEQPAQLHQPRELDYTLPVPELPALQPLTYDTPVREAVAINRITESIVQLYWNLVTLSAMVILAWRLAGLLIWSAARPQPPINPRP